MLRHFLTTWSVPHALIWFCLGMGAFFCWWFVRQLKDDGTLKAVKDWLVTPYPDNEDRT